MRRALILAFAAAWVAAPEVESPALAAAQAAMRNLALANIPDNTWVRLSATMPANRNGGAEVFWAHDPVNRVIVHYGGCTSPYSNEQWNFDLGTERWTLKYPHNTGAPANLPAGGCSRGLAYDSRRGVVWIHGGASNGGIGAGSMGLYSYNAATNVWTKAVENWGVMARFGSNQWQAANGLAYDSVNDLLVSIGRVPAGVADVWVYDIRNQIWNARSYDPVVNGTGYVPVTFDPDIARFVFFNGDSTWTYDAPSDVWTQKVTSAKPPGWRNHVGMAYDTRNKVHILYGGRGGANDTWVYNARANTWTEMRPAQRPPDGIDTMLMSYDPEHNVCVLSDYRPGSPLWVYRYSSAGTPPPPPPPPPPAGTNDAQFVSQSVPATLTAGQSVAVSVTMRNTGTTTWTEAAQYRLSSQGPPDNTVWGVNRATLSSAASVAPGQTHTFSFTLTAPASPGTYLWRWSMVQDGVGVFGQTTADVNVVVSAGGPAPGPGAAVPTAREGANGDSWVNDGCGGSIAARGSLVWPALALLGCGLGAFGRRFMARP